MGLGVFMSESELSAEVITANLKTGFVGKRVLYHPVTSSTMDIARTEVQKSAPEGTVVIADEQTAGRGRIQRAWLTPKGNSIAMSVILYPSKSELPYLIMLASLAVAKSIKSVTGLSPQIKWPNDVLINGRKVSGILIENGMKGSEVAYAIIGIGVNVNLSLADVPEIRNIATSLSDEVGHSVSRVVVVQEILTEMEKMYLSFKGENRVFDEWRDNLVTLGKKVKATATDAIYEGIAESVSRDGSLTIRMTDGKTARVIAGDVTLRE